MTYDLKLRDFEIDEGDKIIIGDKIEHLLEVSPSDSAVRTEIIKTTDNYRGVLQIFSSQGKFFVESMESSLEELIHALFKLMHREIKYWRTSRFTT